MASELDRELRRYLAEDRFDSDVTSLAVVPPKLNLEADLVCQGNGVVSGMKVADRLAACVGIRAVPHVRDGASVHRGQKLLTLSGNARAILGAERTLVNLMMHLSGVATETHKMVVKARSAKRGFRIAATRKTLPGLRDLEKEAVVHGGGETHRRDLSSAILLKGNHETLVGFEVALQRAKRYAARHRLELMVEVSTEGEAIEAARTGASRILIDNLSPTEVRDLVDRLSSEGLRKGIEIEVSGGIVQSNVASYARSGADLASSGHVTHSAPALPMHLVIRRLKLN
jgi:nicotinate-nucleotide pyrophosphorylase (carboxylating)